MSQPDIRCKCKQSYGMCRWSSSVIPPAIKDRLELPKESSKVWTSQAMDVRLRKTTKFLYKRFNRLRPLALTRAPSHWHMEYWSSNEIQRDVSVQPWIFPSQEAAILWYPGSFAPFHLGHLNCLRVAKEVLSRTMYIAGAYIQPHPLGHLTYKMLVRKRKPEIHWVTGINRCLPGNFRNF